jgi:hypothetical protein
MTASKRLAPVGYSSPTHTRTWLEKPDKRRNARPFESVAD